MAPPDIATAASSSASTIPAPPSWSYERCWCRAARWTRLDRTNVGTAEGPPWIVTGAARHRPSP